MGERGARLIRLAMVLLMASGLWACEGDDGAVGVIGPVGPPGVPGPPGPPPPPGGTGAVPIGSTEKINIEVMSVTTDASGIAPVVELTLTNDLTQGLFGLPAPDIRFVLSQLSAAAPGSGGSNAWQSYVTGPSNGVPDAQASTEPGSSGTFVDNGDGTYQYTFESALNDYPAGPVFDPAKTHRLGIEIRGQAPISTNGIFDFVPITGAAPVPGVDETRLIVDNDTCDACHDRLEFHGGPRTDVTYCVACHNPFSTDEDSGNSVNFVRLIHNIHSGRDGFQIVGFRGSVHDYTDVVWTQDLRNCQTCHEENDADTPQASNWRLVPYRQACGTCHYDDGDAGNGVHDYAIEDGMHPGGFNFNDDTQCVDCHGPDGTVENDEGQLVQTQEIHRIPALEASENFVFKVEAVRNVVSGGPPLEVDYSVADKNGVFYDLDTAPEFIACGDGTSRLAIDIGWSTEDYTNAGSGNTNATPLGINALSAAAGCGVGTDADGDNIFTAVAASGLPAGLTGTIGVAIEGHPGSDLDGDGSIGGRNDRVAVTSAIAYFGIDGAAATPRRNEVVDIKKCDDCHKQLSLHGNNRTDKPEVCVICHNPNATDIRRRVADSDCVNELGTDDQPIDFKNMIHGIHNGSIGVCGFGNSAHAYFNTGYPGHLNNCEGCHEPGAYYPKEPGEFLGTTVDAVDPAIVTDDIVVSPNASVCSACHTDFLDAEHMKQNGGDFDARKAADSSLISSGVETCTLCHGPGRIADVAEMHGVGEFEFN